MESKTFELNVSYSQICVFVSTLANPFNDWTEEQAKQGFSWREGSVSFRTVIESGTHSISVSLKQKATEIDSRSVRVIEVPFEVPQDGRIDIATIEESEEIIIPQGSYSLQCEFLWSGNLTASEVVLTFVPSHSRVFKAWGTESEILP